MLRLIKMNKNFFQQAVFAATARGENGYEIKSILLDEDFGNESKMLKRFLNPFHVQSFQLKKCNR